MAIHYGTMHLPPAKRFGYWQDVVCRTLVPGRGRPEGLSPFDARMAAWMYGPVLVAQAAAPDQSWVRDAEDLRRAPRDEFLLSLMLRGEGRLTQAGREVVQRPGDMVLYDTSREFSYRLAADVVLLKIPRRLLPARVASAARQTARPLAAKTAIAEFAADLLRRVTTLDLPDGSTAAARVGASLLDVLGAVLDVDASADPDRLPGRRDERASTLESIQSYMRARIEDPRLDIRTVARVNGVSPRTLARLFAAAGTTPMRWLWAQRLEAGYRMLCEGWAGRVIDVAFAAGFNDLSHFSRSFKQCYGVPPGRLMRRGVSATSVATVSQIDSQSRVVAAISARRRR